MSLIMTEPFIVIADKLKLNENAQTKLSTLLSQFPVLPAHGFDDCIAMSASCTMWNIYERDNLGRRTEFHLSAILKHLVGRNNAVVLVDDGKNKCSVKIILCRLTFFWLVYHLFDLLVRIMGLVSFWRKKSYTTIKTFSFLQTKTCQREMPKTQFAKRIWFFRGKGKASPHSLFGFLLYFLAIMASPACRQIVLWGILKSFGKKYVKLQKAQGNANVCVISLWFLAAYC